MVVGETLLSHVCLLENFSLSFFPSVVLCPFSQYCHSPIVFFRIFSEVQLVVKSGNVELRLFIHFYRTFTMLSRVCQVSRMGFSLARASSTARVWIDKNTKVIGQGITGKNVNLCKEDCYGFRVLSTPSRLLSMELTWLEE